MGAVFRPERRNGEQVKEMRNQNPVGRHCDQVHEWCDDRRLSCGDHANVYKSLMTLLPSSLKPSRIRFLIRTLVRSSTCLLIHLLLFQAYLLLFHNYYQSVLMTTTATTIHQLPFPLHDHHDPAPNDAPDSLYSHIAGGKSLETWTWRRPRLHGVISRAQGYSS